MSAAFTPFIGSINNFDYQQHDWVTFKSKLQQFFLANDLNDVSDKAGLKRRAILLSAFTDESFKLASNLVLPKSLEEIGFGDIFKSLDAHFTPKRCGFAVRSQFYAATQQPGESYAQWAVRLRGLAAHCSFKHLEDALLDKFVMGMSAGPRKTFRDGHQRAVFSEGSGPAGPCSRWTGGRGPLLQEQRLVKSVQCVVVKTTKQASAGSLITSVKSVTIEGISVKCVKR